MNDFKLYSAGVEYKGFQSISISKSITDLAGSFSLGITEKQISQTEFYLMSAGDNAEIKVRGETIINGYIDSRSLRLNKSGRQISVNGRDKAADLVDCSVQDLREYKKSEISFAKLAQSLCRPYGVSVRQIATGSFNVLKLSSDPGQTVFEVLDLQARKHGLLIYSNGKGEVLISAPGVKRSSTDLVEGENIVSIGVELDVSNLFQNYKVLAQSPGDDELNLGAANEAEGLATDKLLKRANRSITIIADENATQKEAQTRAEWEATVRRARARVVTVTVPTWFNRDNKLWELNTLIRVTSPSSYIDDILLIESLDFNFGVNGSTTTMRLVSRNSFKPEPVIEKDEVDFLGI